MAYIILITILLTFLCFYVVSTLISSYGGVNYVGSGKKMYEEAFKLLDLKKGEKFYELGSGYGLGLLKASQQFQAKPVGIEISPFYYLVSRIITFNKKINIHFSDIDKINLSEAEKVYCYLIPKLMAKYEKKFETELKKGTLLVSLAFKLPNKRPFIVKDVNGRKLFLYKY